MDSDCLSVNFLQVLYQHIFLLTRWAPDFNSFLTGVTLLARLGFLGAQISGITAFNTSSGSFSP